MTRAAIAALLVALLAACTEGTIYHHYAPTPVAGWEKADTVAFCVGRIHQAGTYTASVGLRTNTMYPFQAITLIVEQTVYPDVSTRRDTVALRLTTPQGEHTGQGISLYQHEAQLPPLRLQADDSLRVVVRHNMMREILPGVSDVGLVVKVKN